MDNRQSTFAGGEIAPTLYGRHDLAKYASSLRACRNALITQHGAWMNRSGTRYVGEVKDSTKAVRLIPFVFDNDQTFVLEFGERYVRFYANGGRVVGAGQTTYLAATTNFAAGVTIELTTPYLASELPRLKYAQIGDIITIVHPSHAPLELKRLATNGTNWSLTAMTVARPTGPLAITLAVPTFPAYDANRTYGAGEMVSNAGKNWLSLLDGNQGHTPSTPSPIQWEDQGATGFLPHTAVPNRPAKEWHWTATAVDALGTESLASSFTYAGIDVTTLSPSDIQNVVLASDRPQTVTWTAIGGTAYYKVYRAIGPYGIYGYVGECTDHSFVDDNQTPDYTRNPPTTDNPFAGAGNYPSVVAFFQQRRWLGGSNLNPQTVHGSCLGDFYNYDVGRIPKDDDAVEFTLASREMEAIRNLLGLRILLTLTSGGEWALAGTGGGAITPSSIEAKPQSYRGSSYLDPISVGNVALYVQSMGNVVRELTFELQADAYGGNDLTVMATHLFQSHKIVDWAYAASPASVIWAVREDGTLLGCTYLREHELIAWHRHDTSGTFENVCAVPEPLGSNGAKEHAVYVVANRVIGGVHKRYIERFTTRLGIPRLADGSLDAKYGVFLDASLSYDAAPATAFSGLGHLEGRAVTVLADGAVLGPYTVTAGAIDISGDLPDGASVVAVGLPYVSEGESLDLTGGMEPTSKSISAVVFEVVDTRGFWFGTDFDHLKEWEQRKVGDSYGAVPPYTGNALIRFPSAYARDARVCFRQIDPLPVTLVALTREVDFGGR